MNKYFPYKFGAVIYRITHSPWFKMAQPTIFQLYDGEKAISIQ